MQNDYSSYTNSTKINVISVCVCVCPNSASPVHLVMENTHKKQICANSSTFNIFRDFTFESESQKRNQKHRLCFSTFRSFYFLSTFRLAKVLFSLSIRGVGFSCRRGCIWP